MQTDQTKADILEPQEADGESPAAPAAEAPPPPPPAVTASKPAAGGGYVVVPGGYDELYDANGRVRPHWTQWYEAFKKWTPQQRRDNAEQLNAGVRETGIAFDLFADPDEAEQPWSIDMAPLVINPTEWAWLEAALTQRAQLMSAIYADLYGAQILLREGIVPAALIYSDPTFLRPLVGLDDLENGLQFFAADLAKDSNGNWRVLDNHAETPAGIGFALANRIVLTHCEGNLFRQSNALRLAPYFQKLQSTIVKRSGIDDPQIVVVTPGPDHHDYFSHAYLARYLNYTLVLGGDLIAEGNEICLKTIAGLKPLNVILRSIESLKADPLELAPNGFDGTTALVQTVRDKGVHMLNQLGTAIVENRGLAAYLPQICQRLLGEELMLREAPRWWLGDPQAREHVLANLPDMLLSTAHEGSGRPGETSPSTDGATLDPDAVLALQKRLELSGASMVAEQKTGFATAPSWDGSQLQPKPYAVRFFLSNSEDGYQVMPGGLSMSVSKDNMIGLYSPEGMTRDVWVISDKGVGPFESLWTNVETPMDYADSSRYLQSRVADNLYWLGRNAERSEWLLRLCRVALSRLDEDSGPEEDFGTVTEALNSLLHKDNRFAATAPQVHDRREIERLVRQLLYDRNHNYGLQVNLGHMRRIAGMSRDRLSSEAWRILNRFFTDARWRRDMGFIHSGQLVDLLDQGLLTLAAFSGVAMENMTRNYGWRFLEMGRRVERAQNLAELFLHLVARADELNTDSKRLMFMLEVGDSFITYRSRYRIMPALPAVIDLLLIDDSNPRSLRFQLTALLEHVRSLPMEPERGQGSEEGRLAWELLSLVATADKMKLSQPPKGEEVSTLRKMLLEQVEKLPELTELVTKRYFTHTREKPHRI